MKNLNCRLILDKLKTVSLAQICRELKLHHSVIKRALINDNLISRYYEILKEKSEPKFAVNFFNKIDTEDKAYWLGFIYADGFVYKRKNRKNMRYVGIELEKKDKNHLEKFAKTIDFKKPLYFSRRSNTETWKIKISSPEMFNDLVRLGCVEKKSLILDWPTQIPDKLMNHFIRGYFDGDGCIYKTSKTSWSVGFTSSTIFIEKLNNYLNSRIGVGLKKILLYPNKLTASLKYTSKEVCTKILDFMYDGSNVALDRKYKLYKDSEKDRKTKRKKDVNLETMVELLSKNTFEVTAKILNIGKTTLRRRINEVKKSRSYYANYI